MRSANSPSLTFSGATHRRGLLDAVVEARGPERGMAQAHRSGEPEIRASLDTERVGLGLLGEVDFRRLALGIERAVVGCLCASSIVMPTMAATCTRSVTSARRCRLSPTDASVTWNRARTQSAFARASTEALRRNSRLAPVHSRVSRSRSVHWRLRTSFLATKPVSLRLHLPLWRRQWERRTARSPSLFIHGGCVFRSSNKTARAKDACGLRHRRRIDRRPPLDWAPGLCRPLILGTCSTYRRPKEVRHRGRRSRCVPRGVLGRQWATATSGDINLHWAGRRRPPPMGLRAHPTAFAARRSDCRIRGRSWIGGTVGAGPSRGYRKSRA
jgi:hypothetical protein